VLHLVLHPIFLAAVEGHVAVVDGPVAGTTLLSHPTQSSICTSYGTCGRSKGAGTTSTGWD